MMRPCHIALGVFVHHYIRLTVRRHGHRFADQESLISIEQKWGPELAAGYLSGIDD